VGTGNARVAGEPGPRCEMGGRTLLSFGVFCFLGSGGWAFKQLVVPWVNPILQRCGNGAVSLPKSPFGEKAYRLKKK